MKLFISCTALIHMLYDGKVYPDELDEGLFYLGCAREGVKSQIDQSLSFKAEMDNARGYHEEAIADACDFVRSTLLEYLARAELEGRLVYRDHPGSNTYEELNKLLAKHGLNSVDPFNGRRAYDRNADYSYPGVRERMKKSNPEVEVSWR